MAAANLLLGTLGGIDRLIANTGNYAEFLPLYLFPGRHRDARVRFTGFQGLGVEKASRLAITLQLSDITHVVEGKGVVWVERIGLLEILETQPALIAIYGRDAAQVQPCHLGFQVLPVLERTLRFLAFSAATELMPFPSAIIFESEPR